MHYSLDISKVNNKEIRPLGTDFRGKSKNGDEISFNNYYPEKNGKPFFGISGEFHFSRVSASDWEDELIKMKLCGVNVVSTYLFWIHHEEEEGVFDFSGRNDIRHFVKLCEKHGLYVILRIGPFDHGEVRNGGLPDWLYGKPFTVRTTEEGFLSHTKKFYSKISEQVSDLFFKDNGPIIGIQLDNEYMHSSAPWENTAGVSDEWVFGGNEGQTYMLALKKMAMECGLIPVVYTATAWGGAIAPDSFLPLWGGYAYRPWIFYSHKGEHPATEEYIYQDYHNNDVVCTDDFRPAYRPEDRPYACCEMGGGMTCCYYYRFKFPGKAVDALSNIKIASGCNFLGYYMFHGGTNPVGKHGTFMNEGQTPKITYDYQAALGEFGQERESYRRAKSIHCFATSFADRLCPLPTLLPEGARNINPEDMDTLRFAVRTDGKRGFLFINNFQDHRNMPDRTGEHVELLLKDETIDFNFGISGDENAVLPFHFDMNGIDLIKATAQPITVLHESGKETYVFFVPDGMQGRFYFEEGTMIDGEDKALYNCLEHSECESFTVSRDGKSAHVLVLNRKMSNDLFVTESGKLIFTDAALLEDKNGFRLETENALNRVYSYPADALADCKNIRRLPENRGCLGSYELNTREISIVPEVIPVSFGKYRIKLPQNFMRDLKNMRLVIDYIGDIGSAFLNGKMIHDNFSNGEVWEIGLKEYAKELETGELTLYIAPLKKGAKVSVESAMAARMEHVDELVGELYSVKARPVYEIAF
ncbi:MAG: beta-galactosidase [Lachnospiraceae bacterium]|nr:beta-galactosidase [Lachnospiraceae bacterium]